MRSAIGPASFLRAEVGRGITRGIVVGSLVALCTIVGMRRHSAIVDDASKATAAGPAPMAAVAGIAASAAVGRLATWIAATADTEGHGYIVVDKEEAMLYVLDGQSRIVAATPALLGAAHGDSSAPGIGDRDLKDVLPSERTTPAGRFVGERGHNARGEDVLWVDYAAGVSIHRVLTSHPDERRLERLASPSAADNRISYGCINVPADFYDAHVAPLSVRRHAIVYVLPEASAIDDVFFR